MLDLKQMGVQELNIEETIETDGGRRGPGWWGVILYVVDEIYEGATRPCDCEE